MGITGSIDMNAKYILKLEKTVVVRIGSGRCATGQRLTSLRVKLSLFEALVA